MATTIYDDYSEFKLFLNNSKNCFEKISQNDIDVKELNELYSFCITPGGRDGGIKDNIVEVFWGLRPYRVEHKISKNGQIQKEHLIERGATLVYSRLDNGKVIVYLTPARTKYFQQQEQFIIIDFAIAPKKINAKIKRHWLYLKAYMNYTSLHGRKSFKNSIIVWYLRTFKEIIIDDKVCDTKFYKYAVSIVKFALTVGLSGFLLFFISKFGENEAVKLENKILIDKLNNLENKLDKIVSNQLISIETTNRQKCFHYDDILIQKHFMQKSKK